MNSTTPDRTDAARRARIRTALIVSGLVDLALAGLFFGWGGSLLKLEDRVAWLAAAVLAAAGVITLFVATLAFGRRGTRRAHDEDAGDGPIVRR